MKKNLTLISIFLAAIIMSMSFISVVGHQSVQANEKESSSPLFAIQTYRATQTKSQSITPVFIGKEKALNIFPTQVKNENIIIKAIQFFNSNPTLLNKLVNKLDQFPYITRLLASYGINKLEIQNYLRTIKNNPSLILDESDDIQNILSLDNNNIQQPLGLSTSNPLGCFIMGIIVLVPLTAFLTLLSLVFTLRILTCLNINDCANTIVNQIWNQLLQGLTQK